MAGGVQQNAANADEWVWECPSCGHKSDPVASREIAREQFRIHRRELCTGQSKGEAPEAAGATDEAPDAQPPEGGADTSQGSDTDMSTTEKKSSKGGAKKGAAKKAPAKKAAAKKAPAAEGNGKPAAKRAKKPAGERKPRVKREGKLFRVATIQNEKTGRSVTYWCTPEGKPRKWQNHLPPVKTFTEIEAKSWKDATARVKAGEGTKRRVV